MARWSIREARRLLEEAWRARDPVPAIRQVSDIGAPAAISRLTVFLDPGNKAVATEALQAIRRLLELTPPVLLRRVDREVRTYWPHFGGTWAGLKPAGLRRLAKRTGDSFTAAAICSMHGNGYVREEAVLRLGEIHTGAELPYLVVRAGDWVDQVRAAARQRLRSRLTESYIPALVRNLALVETSLARRGTDLLAEVEAALSVPAARPELLSGLRLPDRSSRRVATRWYVRLRHEPLETLIEVALDQDDIIVADLAARAGLDRYDGEDLLALVERLRVHWIGRIRALGLWTLVSRFPTKAEAPAAAALLDRNGAVREIAQRHLSSLGRDVAPIYRERLESDTAAALVGLAETGEDADVRVALAYLNADAVAIRRAATRLIATLDPGSALHALLQRLQDPSPGVSREALKGLKRVHARIAEDVWRIVEATSLSHVRINGVRLLARVGKWRKLVFGLRAASSSQSDLQERGTRLVEACLAGWNRSYAQPTPEEVQEVMALLSLAEDSLGSAISDRVKFSVSAHVA